jgi:uncharacterized protein GlcG (DUF336 family)
MRHKFSLAFAAVVAAFPIGSAVAQVGERGHSLPLTLALKGATKAIAACEGNGYPVSAVIVDPSGIIKVEVKSDHSTVHTATSAFRNAYTVVTFGPIFRFDASSAFAALTAKNPNGAALATLPDVAPLAGGVAIKIGDEIVAALGVSGSPGGDKDEACAQARIVGIKQDLASSR